MSACTTASETPTLSQGHVPNRTGQVERTPTPSSPPTYPPSCVGVSGERTPGRSGSSSCTSGYQQRAVVRRGANRRGPVVTAAGTATVPATRWREGDEWDDPAQSQRRPPTGGTGLSGDIRLTLAPVAGLSSRLSRAGRRRVDCLISGRLPKPGRRVRPAWSTGGARDRGYRDPPGGGR
jgi:hypothetical protein